MKIIDCRAENPPVHGWDECDKPKLLHPQHVDITRNPLSKVISNQSIPYLKGIV